ncbi:MAG: membrane protein required for colicin V production [Saprospiraceae bacterium]|jgi:membrane protein required for colicin V production
MDIGVVDIIVIISLIYSMYHGFTKGLIISLASLAGLVLGVWGAVKFSGFTGQLLSDKFDIHIPILSFALTFIAILFGIYFLGKLVEKVVNILSLGFLNKAGGALFNGVKMMLILTVAFVLVTQVNSKFDLFDDSKITSAFSYPYLKILEENLTPLVGGFGISTH